MRAGLFDVSRRIFPSDPIGDAPSALHLEFARGESGACQLAVRREAPPMEWALDNSTGTSHWTTLAVGATAGNGKLRLRLPDAPFPVRVRTVGNVPLKHHAEDTPAGELDGDAPGMYPDVLFDRDELYAGVMETALFWISFAIPRDFAPGEYECRPVLESGEETMEFRIGITVHPLTLPEEDDFLVTHWLDIGSLLAYYKTETNSERFRELLERYLKNLREHGNTMAWIPWLEPVRIGSFKAPQLLKITGNAEQYRFSWERVERYVKLCIESGFTAFEFEHLASPWGAAYGRQPYLETGGELWPGPPPAGGNAYRDFLTRLLPELGGKLKEWGIAERTFLHISDEPQPKDLENYLAMAKLVRDLLPGIRTIDALSDREFIDAEALDMPVPIVGCVDKFRRAGVECMCYFCCGPKLGYVNRFLDTPLSAIRVCGWLFHRFEVKGFLHWAANYWRAYGSNGMIDPFQTNDGNHFPEWPGGDCFIQYPGEDGPLDSIRSELFFFGLQDRLLLKAAGVEPDSPLLAGLDDFNRFPTDPEWIGRVRKKLFQSQV